VAGPLADFSEDDVFRDLVLLAAGYLLGSIPFGAVIAHVASDVDTDAVLRRAKAFYDDPQYGRIWHMGILLAARDLRLNLDEAVVAPSEIRLRSPQGIERVIPTDRDGYFYIDWSLPANDRRLSHDRFESLLQQDIWRTNGKTNIPPVWRNKLVVIGSIGTGWMTKWSPAGNGNSISSRWRSIILSMDWHRWGHSRSGQMR